MLGSIRVKKELVMPADDKADATEATISRRVAAGGLTAVALSAASPAIAEAVAAPEMPQDEALMREAIALAAQADFPFGALIVRDGVILARGLNEGKRTRDPTAHGEMVAIRHFLAEHGPDALKGTTLYTSGEPCVMCMGAIVWCGISRVVYAASIAELSAHIGQVMITCTEIAAKASFANIEITGGVLAEEAIKLFR